MTAPTIVFDRALVRRRRMRAVRRFAEHDFLFRAVAESLNDRIDFVRRDFARVLVVGARDGGLAKRLAARPGVEILVHTELDAAPFDSLPGLHAVADEEWLPFAEASFDLIVAPLTLHAVNDLPGVLIQFRRALKPDGLLLAALFGGETLIELRQAMSEAEIATESGLSPRIAPVVDLRDMAGLLQRAGFAMPVADAERFDTTYADPLALMRELRGMGESNALAARRRTFLRRATLGATCDIYRRNFADAEGRIRATFEIISLAAWAPHESQPKPLRPGSAKSSLADVLGTPKGT